VRNQRQAYAAHNDGHGGAARPRSRRGYGSLSESVVEPEPASESVDDTNEECTSSIAKLVLVVGLGVVHIMIMMQRRR
jgi:hypothetical protein